MIPRLLTPFILYSLLTANPALAVSPYAVPGRFIVKTKPLARGVRVSGLTSVDSFTVGDASYDVVEVLNPTPEGLERLRKSRAVLSVEPDFYVYAPELESEAKSKGLPVWCFFPNAGTRFEECKDVKKVETQAAREPPALNPAPKDVIPAVEDPEAKRLYGLRRVEGHNAWKYGVGQRSIVVGIVDSGVDYNHEDLSANLWRGGPSTIPIGFDFLAQNKLPYDQHGHGTHINGIIGAVGGNGLGGSGVSQRVSLLNARFMDANNVGTGSGAIKAAVYAINQGARILNNSWGTRMDDSQAMSAAVEYARAKGVLFVVAAGNQTIDLDYDRGFFPTCLKHDNIISVAATDSGDTIAAFSNFGSKTVHLAAPGAFVRSTLPGSKYGYRDGTSMSAPFVAGAAALLLGMKPDLKYTELKEILLVSADRVSGLKDYVSQGRRLNVRKATEELKHRYPRAGL